MTSKAYMMVAAALSIAASIPLAHAAIGEIHASAKNQLALAEPLKPLEGMAPARQILPDACLHGAMPCHGHTGISRTGAPVRIIQIHNVPAMAVCAPGTAAACRTGR